jgi:type I restriction enzyme M protein
MLKAPGRGAVVIKNTFLSNTDNASVSLRKHLLESCNLHTVLDCPGGTFQGAGVKTVGQRLRHAQDLVLPARPRPQPRQDQSAERRRPGRVREAAKEQGRLAQELDHRRQDHRPDHLRFVGEKPEGHEEVAHRSPKKIMDEIAALDAESAKVLAKIRGLV